VYAHAAICDLGSSVSKTEDLLRGALTVSRIGLARQHPVMIETSPYDVGHVTSIGVHRENKKVGA
jgi:hypothetical protein